MSKPSLDNLFAAQPNEPVSVDELVDLIYHGDNERQGIGTMLYELYSSMDHNNDGNLTPADDPENPEFAILDFNIDGFDQGLRASLRAMVGHFDADRSGRLSIPELEKIQEHLNKFSLDQVNAMDPVSQTITTESLIRGLDGAINHGLPSISKPDSPQR